MLICPKTELVVNGEQMTTQIPEKIKRKLEGKLESKNVCKKRRRRGLGIFMGLLLGRGTFNGDNDENDDSDDSIYHNFAFAFYRVDTDFLGT
jgi:hypothetical protein